MLNGIQRSQFSGMSYASNSVSKNDFSVKNSALERMPASDCVSFGENEKTSSNRYISYSEIMECARDIEYSAPNENFFTCEYKMTGDNGVNPLQLNVSQGSKGLISGKLGDRPVNLKISHTSSSGQAGYVKGSIGDVKLDLYYAKMGDGIRIQKISKENENFIPLVSILIADKISFDEQCNVGIL